MSVSHHGDREEIETMKRFMAQLEGNAKRQYPAGRMGHEDDGELSFAIAADPIHKTVVIRFGKPIEWIGLSAKDCVALAEKLIDNARKIATEPIAVRIGSPE